MGILTEMKARNVSGDDDHGRRIEGGISHTGYRIGHSRSHVDQENTGFVGDSKVTISSMGCYLLVAKGYEFDVRLISQSVQQRYIGMTAEAKYVLHTFLFQISRNNLSTISHDTPPFLIS